jgi:hypothetical protein
LGRCRKAAAFAFGAFFCDASNTAQPWEARMTGKTPESTQKQPQQAAIEHIAEAHSILKRLRDRLDQHPELEQAIEELELALSKLTLRTGGML